MRIFDSIGRKIAPKRSLLGKYVLYFRRGKNIRIKVNSSVGKLAELSSLLELCGLLSVLRIS